MNAKVILLVREGNLPEREVCFTSRTTYLVGRGADSDLCLREDRAGFISRRHCLFEISPPGIRVRDLGSRNGTYVNGQNIGKRLAGQRPEEANPAAFGWHTLAGGDVVYVGSTRIRVAALSGGAPLATPRQVTAAHQFAGHLSIH